MCGYFGKKQGKAVPPAEQRQPAQRSLPGAQTLPAVTHGSPAPRDGCSPPGHSLSGHCWEEGLALSVQKERGHLLPPLHGTCWDTARQPQRGTEDTPTDLPAVPSLPTTAGCSGISGFPSFHHPQPCKASTPVAPRDQFLGQGHRRCP